MTYAIEAGNLEMVQWLHENGFAAPTEQDLLAASRGGHNDIVKWLLKTFKILVAKQERALAAATERCDLEVVQLVQALYPPKRYSEWLFRTAESSSSRDLAELAQDRMCAYSYPWTLTSAAANDHLAVVQWLFYNLRGFCYHTVDLENSTIEAAAGNGHADIVEWIYLRVHMDDESTRRPSYDLTYAVENGHLELVKWIGARAEVILHMRIVAYVAANGHLAMLKWLHHEFPDSFLRDSGVMAGAVQNDHLPVVQWLHEHHRGDTTWQTMVTAASFEMIQLMHAHNYGFESPAYAMSKAAERGDFDALLFLHANRHEGRVKDAAFSAFVNGHLLIFEWLYEMYPDDVDLNDFRSDPTSTFGPAFVSALVVNRTDSDTNSE